MPRAHTPKVQESVVCSRFAIARMAKRLSVREAEEAMGIKKGALKRIEAGEQRLLLSTVFAAAQVFDVSVAWISGLTEVGGPTSAKKTYTADELDVLRRARLI